MILYVLGAMMSVDESLMCSFQILKPGEKKPPNAGGNRKVFFFYSFITNFYKNIKNLVCELIEDFKAIIIHIDSHKYYILDYI